MKPGNSSIKNKGKGRSDKPFARKPKSSSASSSERSFSSSGKPRTNSSSEGERKFSSSRKPRTGSASGSERSFSSTGKPKTSFTPREEKPFSSSRKARTNSSSGSDRPYSSSRKPRTDSTSDKERNFSPNEGFSRKPYSKNFSSSDRPQKAYPERERDRKEGPYNGPRKTFSKPAIREVRGFKKDFPNKGQNDKAPYTDRANRQYSKNIDEFDNTEFKDASGPRKSVYSKKKQLEYNKKNFDVNAPLRLNKYIANTGLCSRREADEYIKTGLISVNGTVITEMGVKVNPTDEIKYNGERLKTEKKVYLILNKPKDYVTTVDDPHAEKTVMHLIEGACHERIYPVGRLDRNTTGVLLFTNDGELTKQLTHPKHNKKKVYHVHLDQVVSKTDVEKLTEGIELDDGMAMADAASYADEGDKKQLGVEIHSGKNRVIRRMFETLGYKVVKLDRVYFAGLTKKGLTRGKLRFLTEQEISMLKKGAYE